VELGDRWAMRSLRDREVNEKQHKIGLTKSKIHVCMCARMWTHTHAPTTNNPHTHANPTQNEKEETVIYRSPKVQGDTEMMRSKKKDKKCYMT
jgi:hypothetical protein